MRATESKSEDKPKAKNEIYLIETLKSLDVFLLKL